MLAECYGLFWLGFGNGTLGFFGGVNTRVSPFGLISTHDPSGFLSNCDPSLILRRFGGCAPGLGRGCPRNGSKSSCRGKRFGSRALLGSRFGSRFGSCPGSSGRGATGGIVSARCSGLVVVLIVDDWLFDFSAVDDLVLRDFSSGFGFGFGFGLFA